MPIFPISFDLSSLDGVNGFKLTGIDDYDASGRSVSSAGDVNGDGFDDVIIGAPFAGPNGTQGTGESYIVFGKGTAFGSSVNLAGLDGTNGFVLVGTHGNAGFSVSSAGDINNDGNDDIIIGAYTARGDDFNSGESYVLLGKTSAFGAVTQVSSLDGANGFRLDGEGFGDRIGRSVSTAGDVNGDGFDDIIVGGAGGDYNYLGTNGQSYIVFGKAGNFSSIIDLVDLDGSNGFKVIGIDEGDLSGYSVSSAGDVNGDGFDDIIIGAKEADISSGFGADGETYVVFGKASGFSASFSLSNIDGSNGFQLNGIDSSDRSGGSVSSAGDFNGDGYDDIIIGASYGYSGGSSSVGESYIVFGKAGGFAAATSLSTLDGSNGFRIDGVDAGERSGISVSSAGDINGDGFDDVIIGATGKNSFAGASYIVFGKAGGFSAAFDLANLDGENGFQINGANSSDLSGYSVSSAGDVNGDGFGDVIIGSYNASPGSTNGAGESYIVFGIAPTASVTLVGSAADQTINGGSFDDVLSGLGGADTLNGASGKDTATYAAATSGVNVYLQYTGIDTGGAGIDTLISIENLTGSAFNDRLIGDASDNVLTGGAGDDIIKGKGGNDTFYGGDGTDRLTGGAGDDIMSGGAGNDILFALAGLDILNGGADDDFLYGGRDNDTLNGDSGDDELRGNLGNDIMNGGAGIDDLRGGGQNDTLDGGADNDFLFGENGLDILFGGAGNDSLTGGAGSGFLDGLRDTFVYSDTAAGGGGFDRIKDWENGTDKIDLTAFNFTDFNADVLPLASDISGGLRISFGGGDVLFVEGFLLADFDVSDVLL